MQRYTVRTIRLRLSILLPIASLLSAFTISAQETPQVSTKPQPQTNQPAPQPARGTITGTVLCADTHKPARGAMVMVIGIPPASSSATQPGAGQIGANGFTRVAMDGTYSVGHLTPGEYTAIAILPGYLSAMDQMFESQMNTDSPSKMRDQLLHNGSTTVHGAETERLDVTLERGAAVSGQVLFSDGSPATQIALDVEDVNAKTQPTTEVTMNRAFLARMVFTQQSQSTDDQGHFRITGLRPGTYRIAALSSQGGPMNADAAEEGMGMMFGAMMDPAALHIYSGDTLHKKSAKTYDLRPGDEVSGITITIPIEAFHKIHGTITAADGRTINKADLTLTDTTDDSVTYKTRTDDDGAFWFTAVPSGTYKLTSSNARITVRQPTAANVPDNYAPVKVTNAFADNSTTLIVKDSDISDATLPLTEVALPKDEDIVGVAAPQP